MTQEDFRRLRIDMWVSGTADKEKDGGYCTLMQCTVKGRVVTKTLAGYGSDVTVTRMTLRAVVEGLKSLKQKAIVHIYTQIPQVSAGINKNMYTWANNDWRKNNNEKVRHADLWSQVHFLVKEKTIGIKVHYQKESPNPDANLYVIHQSSEYVMRAKKTLKEVIL